MTLPHSHPFLLVWWRSSSWDCSAWGICCCFGLETKDCHQSQKEIRFEFCLFVFKNNNNSGAFVCHGFSVPWKVTLLSKTIIQHAKVLYLYRRLECQTVRLLTSSRNHLSALSALVFPRAPLTSLTTPCLLSHAIDWIEGNFEVLYSPCLFSHAIDWIEGIFEILYWTLSNLKTWSFEIKISWKFYNLGYWIWEFWILFEMKNLWTL